MAANPVIVPCPADTWTKVATAVSSGVLHKKDTSPALYLQTYRLTGQAAPTDNSEAIPLFDIEISAAISNDAPVDVYIKAVGKGGSVRVDT